ncbi:MAG TPA: hypothetical protein VGO15_10135, partial [Candidatus Limnocylindrales bacterium]|nr:hypothetical protein [Candidatus Limnocylindrales bacterium]
MKRTSIGRSIALASVAIMVFAACSGGGSSSAPSTAASAGSSVAASAAASAAGSGAAGAPTIGYLPKDIVNQYFAAAKTGVDKAAGELGG